MIHALATDHFLGLYAGKVRYRSFLNDIDVQGQLTGRRFAPVSYWDDKLPNYLLTVLGDRMEMAHSVEGRVPFLDHRLVEVACSQPVTQKIRGLTHKYVLRESVRDLITETVYRRPKQAFLSRPGDARLCRTIWCTPQDTLRSPVLASMPFFDQKKVVRLLDSLRSMNEVRAPLTTRFS